MRRVEAIITGKVQGVSFRASTKRKAKELGLDGWVKNLPDGSVGLVAEGEGEAVSELLEWCRRGPAAANVENVEITEGEPEGKLDGFEIRY